MEENSLKIPEGLISELRKAESVTVLTGSGISAESGVPTFRDAQSGLWAKYRPEDLATPEAFRKNPELVWEWYTWRRELCAAANPNPGHYALAKIQNLVKNFHLITQNVDGLHQQAGSREVIELHGNIQRTKCFNEGQIVESWKETGEKPPRCPDCKGWLRPDVVWFGEMLPSGELEKALMAARNCQVFFSIGTSSLVQPAASFPYLALDNGAILVEINPLPTPLTAESAYIIQSPAGKALPKLVEAVWG
jgi:NAD-dependent deacetylase